MSSNPVYSLFATPKSFGPFLLRMLLAAVFVYHGGQKAFAWFDGPGWSATIANFSGENGMGFPVWVAPAVMCIELAGAVAMFFGVLTRVAALGLAGVMAGAVFFVHAGDGIAASEYAFSLMIAALSLVFLGGGRFSVDRAVSAQLIPSWD